MNIFESGELKSFEEKWRVSTENPPRRFTEDELKYIAKAHFTQGDYGMSVCLTLVSGKVSFIDLDKNSPAGAVGEEVDPRDLVYITLSKTGRKDCHKVKVVI